MDQIEATPIPGTERATEPFFSPNGQWIGFWADDQLKKVSVAGGLPVTLCDTPALYAASWGPDDTILFSGAGIGISRVSGSGGTPEVIVPVKGREGFRRPRLLPGGEWILFSVRPSDQIVIQSLVTGERRVLMENGGDVTYLPTGHLAYVQDARCWRCRLTRSSGPSRGHRCPLVQGVGPSG